jgi:hypothetical protein
MFMSFSILLVVLRYFLFGIFPPLLKLVSHFPPFGNYIYRVLNHKMRKSKMALHGNCFGFWKENTTLIV